MNEHRKYCQRFGKIAVDRGYLLAEQLQQALREQVDDDLVERPHRVLGAICFDHGWMSPRQIDEVLNLMFKMSRTEPELITQ
ncbi:hypothetical protein [Geopsychrobacter electrodiphilus]|uniref:hypothetical protein n=1 Tax=Geopsychrobacter electrodiphilus TaxID=225196 RepID=UPI000366D912|nr:hypothetical protein [Geopsychrobacter electrodiphilus]